MTMGEARGRLLVVEDDEEMGRLLVRGLSEDGYEVDWARNGVDALIVAGEQDFAATILDVMLPGMSGFEVCRRLRVAQPLLPILLLTARDAVDDRVRGLDAGADDYLIKPFAFTELHARLRAIRRREQLVPAQVLRVGALRIDSHDHEVTSDDRAISLSPKEFAVLRLLAENVNATVSRETILTEIWGSSDYTDANVVDQYVSYLRRKMSPEHDGVTIMTERGIGFRLQLPE
ncbi:DNA-binding response OmpR family regulator [Cryobacterium sp. CG_9.6]|nr:DNA-binding response OmpR family regulator [Cryobacterium sp. CG_9.6]